MSPLDAQACYRAVQSRDRRFDGMFYTGVRTTGIYCRPSCPAVTPRREHVAFYPTAAAAQGAGLRACRRCLPDATPGSPQWDMRADVAGRAMRLVADGLIEREGVAGLAARLGYSQRQLNRLISEQYGAGPLALSRSRRVRAARVLIETTDLSMADVAFAAGFGSIRQFNATVREVYAITPSLLRARGRRGRPASERLVTRIAVREPFAAAQLLRFLGSRALPGVEWVEGSLFGRSLRLPHAPAIVTLDLSGATRGTVPCTLELGDLRDLAPALERVRRLVDADCDPHAVDERLATDPLLAPLVSGAPGLRVPGHVDGFEMAVRAVLGQQITESAARTLAARLVDTHGEPAGTAMLFPSPERLARLDVDAVGMPASRQQTVRSLAMSVTRGELRLDRSASREETRAALLRIRGIGPWTADYVAMRALGDPDVFLPTDVGVRRAAAALGVGLGDLVDASQAWRPWRSYGLVHLWSVLR